MEGTNPFAGVVRCLRGIVVASGAFAGALACFLVLPLLQAISSNASLDLTLVPVHAADLPPPPPAEPEVKEEENKEDEPPKLEEESQPLDLQQLELALGAGEAGVGGDFVVKLPTMGGGTNGGDDAATLFSLNDLDQRPRLLHNPGPVLNAALRKKMPASVTVLFVVDQSGRVENPIVQSSSDPAFEAAALSAVKQWKFEPGKRGGVTVRCRMRQPFKFEG